MSGLFDDLFRTLQQIDDEVTRLEQINDEVTRIEREKLKQTNMATKQAKRINKKRKFTEEECLSLGLYPNDEAYKMSLISRILGKRR